MLIEHGSCVRLRALYAILIRDELFHDRNHFLRDEVALVLVVTLKEIQADGEFHVRRIENDNIANAMGGYPREDLFEHVAVRVNDAHTVSILNVREDHGLEQCCFSRSRLPDDIQMAPPIIKIHPNVLLCTRVFADADERPLCRDGGGNHTRAPRSRRNTGEHIDGGRREAKRACSIDRLEQPEKPLHIGGQRTIDFHVGSYGRQRISQCWKLFISHDRYVVPAGKVACLPFINCVAFSAC